MQTHPVTLVEPRRMLLAVAPIVAIASAGFAARTPLALAWPRAAFLLLLWIAADATMLALLARTPRARPQARTALAALAAAFVAVLVGAPAALRHALVAMPAVAVAMLAVIVLHLGWSVARAARRFAAVAPDAPGGARWRAAAAEILPPAFVRFAAADLALLRLALFRWGAAPDVPAGAQAHAYHRHLAPMVTMLLLLQVVEIAVVHLLVRHWSHAAALVLLGVGIGGAIYMVGLLKSFRLRPVLLAADGIHVRTGIAIDRVVAYAAVAGIDDRVDRARVRDPATLNVALLAWPNLVIALRTPVARRGLFRARPPIAAIALRLDDPVAFVRALEWRLAQG